MPLSINDIAPDFTAETTEGKIDFHNWAGDSWVVLFSHPKDYTPVCTTELGTVARLKPEFDKRGVKVIGLSVDPVANHAGWAKDIAETQGTAVNFPMIADTELKVAKLYGMLPADTAGTSEGRTPADNATVRNVFVIGPDKKIKLVLVYPMAVGRNFQEILRAIDGLLHAWAADLALLVPVIVQHHQPTRAQHGRAEAEVDHHAQRRVGAVDVDQVERAARLQHPGQLVGREALVDAQAAEAELGGVALEARLDRVILLFRVKCLVEPRVDHRNVELARQQPVHEGEVAALVGADLQVIDAFLPLGEAAQHWRHEGDVVVRPEVGELEAVRLGMRGERRRVLGGPRRRQHGLGEGRRETAVDRGERAQGIGHGSSEGGEGPIPS